MKNSKNLNVSLANCVIRNSNKTHILNVDVKDIKLDDNTFVYIMSF